MGAQQRAHAVQRVGLAPFEAGVHLTRVKPYVKVPAVLSGSRRDTKYIVISVHQRVECVRLAERARAEEREEPLHLCEPKAGKAPAVISKPRRGTMPAAISTYLPLTGVPVTTQACRRQSAEHITAAADAVFDTTWASSIT